MSSSRIGSTSMATTSTKDDDVLMSKEHKQILREFRDQLVDNMYPDDILNQLQSQKVLTHRDSTRIKEKGSAETMNESLLDILMRKPDRAFSEFINALRESDQNHVANIIDKNRESTPKEKRDLRKSRVHTDEEDEEDFASPSSSRKRKLGEIGVKLNVDKLEFDEDEDEDTVESQRRKRRAVPDYQDLDTEQERIKKKLDIKLLKVISKEVDNLDRVVSSSGISQSSVGMRRAALETIKELQKYRREITSVDFGSVIFTIVCRTLEGLDDLRMLCTSGRLAAMAEKIFSRDVLRQFRLRRVMVAVSMDPAEYDTCRRELETINSNSPEDVENKDPCLSDQHEKIKRCEAGDSADISSSFRRTWPVSSHPEDLDLVQYLSLRSPPHTPSTLEEFKPSKLLCRKSAEEKLIALGLTDQVNLLTPRPDHHIQRGRSPVRRYKVRNIKERLKQSKKSLSLSPLPVSRQGLLDVKSVGSKEKTGLINIHFRSQTSPTRLTSPIRH